MKPSLAILILTSFFSLGAFAQGSGGSRGGGDHCKNEIEKHRADILTWIESGQASKIDFSRALNKDLNYSTYKEKMLAVLQPGKVVITCYLDPSLKGNREDDEFAAKYNVAFKAITVGDNLGKPARPVACINEERHGVSYIDCNFDTIIRMADSHDLNYSLTHHEFASIAGVELRSNSYTSDFSISDQLGRFEHFKLVRVLGEENKPLPPPKMCMGYFQAGFDRVRTPGTYKVICNDRSMDFSITDMANPLDIGDMWNIVSGAATERLLKQNMKKVAEFTNFGPGDLEDIRAGRRVFIYIDQEHAIHLSKDAVFGFGRVSHGHTWLTGDRYSWEVGYNFNEEYYDSDYGSYTNTNPDFYHKFHAAASKMGLAWYGQINVGSQLFEPSTEWVLFLRW